MAETDFHFVIDHSPSATGSDSPMVFPAVAVARLDEWRDKIEYSDKVWDSIYEYRYVVVPRDMVEYLPKNRTMSESEWRKCGIVQSFGWEHYDQHFAEHHILLFRRARFTDPRTGQRPHYLDSVVHTRAKQVRFLEHRYRQAIWQKSQDDDQLMTDL